MGRFFGKHDRAAARIMTGRSGHADHIVPYSRGGATHINNLQNISAAMNAKKGSYEYKPRLWQQEFHKRYSEYQSIGGPSFLLVATPGSGKTHAALHECQRFRNEYGSERNRLVIIVPTDNLRTRWIEDATKHGIDLSSDPTQIKDGYDGVIITYQGMTTAQPYMQRLCHDYKVMLVCDEVHHCGDENSWGSVLRASFGEARARLMMSGTPARTDGTPIPYITYDEQGFFVPDYMYLTTEAVRDGIIRPVQFWQHQGSVEMDGRIISINKDCDEDNERYLGRLVSASGDFAREMLEIAREKVDELRMRGVADAAALVVVSDQAAASIIANRIRELTGERAEVIVSDESRTTTTVERFRDGPFRNDPPKWLVAVQKVSEGTDIPRLQVLVWLTNKTTELAFRQLVGRVIRMRLGQQDNTAHVVLPEVPTLARWASLMESESRQGLLERNTQGERETSERTKSNLLPFTTRYDGPGDAIIAGEHVSSADAQWYSQIAALSDMSIETVMKVMKAQRELQTPPQFTATRPGMPVEVRHDDEPMQVKEERLRAECQRLATKLAHFTASQEDRRERIKAIHAEYAKRYGKGQDQMSVNQLEQKRDDLDRRIRAYAAQR